MFLAAHGAAFGLTDAPELLVRRVQTSDEVGMDHVRLQQLHQGIPVTAAEINVHLQGANVLSVNAKTLPDLDGVGTVSAVQPAEASRAVRELLAKYLAITNALLSEPRLEIFNRGLLDGTRVPTRLAWFIEATRTDLRRFFWVDAQNGRMLLHFNQLANALDRRVYTATCTSSLPGSLLRTEGGAATGDVDADDAYTFAGDTYNYYWTEFGRDSYDGAGAPIISTVHWTDTNGVCSYQNAYWNGSQMVYGDGFASAEDVVAHELTHAVTERTAGLYYYMQSGALNESYSDIFGETVELTNGHGTNTPAARWLMGENLPIGPVRDLMNPTAFGNPGKMSDPEFACADPGGDAGGVHSNSGVPSHAYALMVDGGIYNGYTITGIGLTKAAHIEYRALTTYLISGSDFLDDYNALCQSGSDLIGTYGITADDLLQVQNALLAVEITNRWPCTPLQPLVPALCGPGQVVSNLFFDDLETTNSGNWSTTKLSGAYNPWIGGVGDYTLYFTDFAASGRYSFWGADLSIAGNSAVQMRVDVAIPEGDVRMQFNHSYGFENYGTTCYDGGVLEYSTNAGSTWFDAGSLITAGAKYGGTISTGTGNPLGGKSAFVQDSYGYTASQLTLTNLAGRNVRFRFRLGTDSSVGDYGWFIDDIRIYQVSTPLFPPQLANIETNPVYYTENQAATAMTSTLTVSDADSAMLTYATVSIAANYALGQDVLSMNAGPPTGIATNYNPANGVLTLSGSNSVADYQAALRAVTYRNTSGNPSTLTRAVTFVVEDDTGLTSNDQTRNIVVTNSPPVAGYVADQTSGSAPLPVTFTNTSTGVITNASWNFGDGTTTNMTATSVWHIYNYAGNNAVSLTVRGPGGTSTTNRAAYIVVTNGPPGARFSASSASGYAPLTVTFDSRSSSGVITNRFWNFDDGSTSNTTEMVVSHTYVSAQPYSYCPTLTVSGPLGIGAATSCIVVTNAAPEPAFVVWPTNGAAHLTVFYFTNLSRFATNYSWSFGDGTTTNTATTDLITHTYSNASNYTVCLTATGAGGTKISCSPNRIGVTNLPPNVLAWGDDSFGQCDVPIQALNTIAIAAGAWHSLALRSSGSVLAWGSDWNGQCEAPPTSENALAVAAGGYHSLAIRPNGAVVAWGANDYGQANVPAGLTGVIGIAAGTWHSVLLRADGTVEAWGDNSAGQTNQPAGLTDVVAVAAGGNHSLALKADGTVAGWGENTDANGNVVGQSVVPWGLTNVVAIAAGEYHSLAVKSDGRVVAWGDNSEGQCVVPPELTNAVAVAAGGAHSVALKSDGTLAAWGANWNGQCVIPSIATNSVTVAAGEYHTLVLLDNDLPAPRLLNPAWTNGQTSLLLQTVQRKKYVLEYKNFLTDKAWTALATNNGNGALIMLTDPGAGVSQRFYRVQQW